MVDLGGYVIILVETKDKKIKLYGKYNIYIIAINIWFVEVHVSQKGTYLTRAFS